MLLPGDATEGVLLDLVATDGGRLRSSILKAPHHGRDSGYCADFVRCVNPGYTIVSVGKKPDTDASNKYRYWCPATFSTRFEGTIHARLFAGGRVEIRNREGVRLDEQYKLDVLGGFLSQFGRQR